MKTNDQVMKEFHSFGYEDSKMGREISDAECFIYTEARRFVQKQFDEIHSLIDNYLTKLKSSKKVLNVGSIEIIKRRNTTNNQKIIDEIIKAINSLNNGITHIEKDINSLTRLMKTDKNVEIENIFCALSYHYETGYLKYKYEKEKDPYSLPEEIDFSVLTRNITKQFAINLNHDKDNLD